VNCTRCNGRGTITCPKCHGGFVTDYPSCKVCHGVKEIQCPACHGKPIYQVVNESITKESQKEQSQKGVKGRTRYQALLTVHYLLTSLGAIENNTKKAEFASFLTGFSENTLRQDLSNIHRKADDNGAVWESDMKTVRRHFEELGLSDVVELIDNDLNSQSE
jgi:RecJ-like exonuclease